MPEIGFELRRVVDNEKRGIPYYVVVQFDRRTRKEREFLREKPYSIITDIEASPDSHWLAVIRRGSESNGRDELLLVSIEEGDSKILFASNRNEGYLMGVSWLPDSKRLLLSQTSGLGNLTSSKPALAYNFWLIDATGREPRKLDFVAPTDPQFDRVHTDGKRIVYTVRSSYGEVWAMENLLPRPTEAKNR